MRGTIGRRTIAVAAAMAVVLGATAPALGAGSSAVGAPASVDPDAVFIGIDVQADGDAQWTIAYRVRLETANETAAYRDIVADVRDNRSAYRERFATRISGTVAAAENATERRMNATNVTVSASIRELPQTYGVLTYTFVWENFAAVEGETLRVGEAIRGFFLDSETTMVVSWPTNYGATTVLPEPTDRRANAVTWVGPLEFADGTPLVVLEPEPATTTAPSPTTPSSSGSNDALLLIGAVFGLLVVFALIAVWYVREREGEPEPTDAPGPGPDGDGETDVETAPSETDPAEADLLSNEERVLGYLREQGGRAKQQEIVDGLDWTEAKTSQVLSSMQSEGEVEKFRIGRENVVKLPEEGEKR
ncbi:MAG: helix-turn-helix transcriptional regulator [Halanaeroarchaeum sp.]